MIFIAFLMLALCLAEMASDIVTAFVRRMAIPRVRFNRGGRYHFS